MTELQLYKFINDKKLEINWRDEDTMLLIWVPYFELNDFMDMWGVVETDDEWTAHLQDRHACIDLVPVCEHFDIDPEHIKEKGDD